ncbi:hypothetical protein NDU88_004809 [Pleurodeles waltl]|uniref:Uncharacterized protein n=1 Tax=Pleurodeles waltl TaxID=8319 RepID=A0AAV7PG89_PLEWA|nr:hypothetical protein NDU88_004809 [Pleurodeles waltl]
MVGMVLEHLRSGRTHCGAPGRVRKEDVLGPVGRDQPRDPWEMESRRTGPVSVPKSAGCVTNRKSLAGAYSWAMFSQC